MGKQLVSLDEYKEYSSINSTEFDDKIYNIITKTSEFVKNYCNRTFIDNYDKATSQFTNIVEYSNVPGIFLTAEFPIQSIVSVELSTDSGTTYTSTTGIVDKSKDVIIIDDTYEGVNAYKVTYKGGFAKTPEDLKLACLDLVDYYYKKESVPRKTSSNNVIEYVMTSDLPSHIKRVLDIYRVIL